MLKHVHRSLYLRAMFVNIATDQSAVLLFYIHSPRVKARDSAKRYHYLGQGLGTFSGHWARSLSSHPGGPNVTDECSCYDITMPADAALWTPTCWDFQNQYRIVLKPICCLQRGGGIPRWTPWHDKIGSWAGESPSQIKELHFFILTNFNPGLNAYKNWKHRPQWICRNAGNSSFT